MPNGSVAECDVTYDAQGIQMERKRRRTILGLNFKAIPWVRIIVDTLLVAGMLLASSNFLSVR